VSGACAERHFLLFEIFAPIAKAEPRSGDA
jgi:hypothetical protein